MNLNGGYAMIKHNATQQELAVAYKTKKPVLLYDENFRAHWAQINEKEVETVDEETHETIITYEYSYQLVNDIEALVDSNGNPRFIDGDGTPATIDGFTATYCKWSLSGTHLMLVLAGTITNGSALTDGMVLASFALPEFVKNKIVAVWGANYIERKPNYFFGNDWTSQTGTTVLGKFTDIRILQSGALTLTANRSFRLQFDLLIDNE